MATIQFVTRFGLILLCTTCVPALTSCYRTESMPYKIYTFAGEAQATEYGLIARSGVDYEGEVPLSYEIHKPSYIVTIRIDPESIWPNATLEVRSVSGEALYISGASPSECFGFFEPVDLTLDRRKPQEILKLSGRAWNDPNCRNSHFLHQTNELTISIFDSSGTALADQALLAELAEAGTYTEFDWF